METPLTPLEFMRRARRLYPDREAVVDGALRLTYDAFFDRCDRWSSALQALGVRQGDRVAYIAPNTHAQLESFYAVPQIGAVLVPINYRLTADDFALHHQPQRRDGRLRRTATTSTPSIGIRAQLPDVEHFVALEGARDGWLDYEALLADAAPALRAARRSTSATCSRSTTPAARPSRPKGVMITHRNAWMNVVGTLVHMPMTPGRPLPVDAADVPRQRLDVHLDRHRGRRARTSACRKVEPRAVFELIAREQVTHALRRADRADRLANAPAELAARRAARRARADRRRAAGGGDDRADRGRARLGRSPRSTA